MISGNSHAFRSMRIMFFAILVGLIGVTTILYLVTDNLVWDTNLSLTDPFVIAASILLVASILAHRIISRVVLRRILDEPQSRRLKTYPQYLIFRLVTIESMGIGGSILMFFTGNLVYLVLTGISIVFILACYPQEERIKEELKINNLL